MIKLLQIEWLKTKGNITFWVLLAIYTLSLYTACSFGTILLNASVEISGSDGTPPELPDFNIYDYPEIWHNLAYLASYVKIILGIIVITLISAEINQRTLKQNIIDGLSPFEFLLSKLSTVIILAILSTTILFITTNYFGASYSESNSEDVYANIEFIGGHFMQILTFLTFCFFIGLNIKSAGLSIVLVLIWTFFLENLLSWIILGWDHPLSAYLPMHAIDNLVSSPFNFFNPEAAQTHVSTKSVAIGLGWTTTLFGISYLRLTKKDL